jgi:hypothetical protein
MCLLSVFELHASSWHYSAHTKRSLIE